MISKLLIGSSNPTKISHYQKYFSDLPLTLVSPRELGLAGEPEETGETIEQNAMIKADYYFQHSGLPTLADDAGFSIPALGGFPGVRSKRFAGRGMADEEIIAGILERMKDLQAGRRRASMDLVVALRLSPTEAHTATARIEGHVPEQPFGKRMARFPYRSLLFVDSLGKWFYDIDSEDEDVLGYRAAAIKQLKQYLG